MSKLAHAGRKQHRFARARASACRSLHRLFERRAALARRTRPSRSAAHRGRSAARARANSRTGRRERREILALAVAAEDQHGRLAPGRAARRPWRRRWCPWNRRTTRRRAASRRARRRCGRPLKLLRPDAMAASDASDCRSQSASGERIGDVVRAVDLQLVDAAGSSRPGRARRRRRPKSARRGGASSPKVTDFAARPRHRHRARHRRGSAPARRAPTKMRALAAPYSSRLGVAVEVVLGQVEHRRRRRARATRWFRAGSSKARAPRLPAAAACALQQRIEHRRPDVARDFAVDARAAQQVAGERGHGGLAVGAGDREHLGSSRRARRRARCRRPPGCPSRPPLRRTGSSSDRPGLMHTSRRRRAAPA